MKTILNDDAADDVRWLWTTARHWWVACLGDDLRALLSISRRRLAMVLFV